VGGVVTTSKQEVLNAAAPVDKGIKSLRLDMATKFYDAPDRAWSDGCRAGFSDSYVRGYYGLSGGVREPIGLPAYVAGYRQAFSFGNGFALGATARKLGKPTASVEKNGDTANADLNFKGCRAGFDAWIKDHPQPDAPKDANDQQALFDEFKSFDDEQWTPFLNGLHDLGVFESGDAAIEEIRSYYDQFIGYVKRFEAFGFRATYVPPPPPQPGQNPLATIAVGFGSAATVAVVGTIGYLGLKLYLDRRQARR